MIHSPQDSRPDCGPTLRYMYRGDGHEHSLNGFNGQHGVIHIGGNMFSGNPIRYDENNEPIVDTSDMEAEFELAAQNNKTASKKFKHYVISIEKGAQLNESQWLEVATDYLAALGFDFSHKWTACIHNDSEGECQHIHILASLVSMMPNQSLVSTSNDYAKGWSVMRKWEERLGLQQLVSPSSDEDFGFNFTKNQIKGHGSRQACIENDWGAIIRARIKNLYQNEGKPKTIRDFALGLAKRNIKLQAVKSEYGKIRGLNYQVLNFKKNGETVDSPIISGSNVKARFSWNKLQQKEGMDYKPKRDNPYIGLAPGPSQLTIRLKLNRKQLRVIKMLGVRIKPKSNYIDLTFCNTNREKQLAILIEKIIEALKELLIALFGLPDPELEFFNYTIYREIAESIDFSYDLSKSKEENEAKLLKDTKWPKWAHLDDAPDGTSEFELAA